MKHKILFIGDIVGKGGRKIFREVLPKWREKFKPDAVIVNVENMAHGKGVTPSTLADIDHLDIDCFTSGNHVFDKLELAKETFEKYPKLIRPGNYESLGQEKSPVPGHGYYRFEKNGRQYLIINLSGQVFMENQYEGEISSPFLAIDKILEQEAQKGDIIIVDFHSEATSEKVAMGWHLNGRVTAILGTHTHVPTADARILPPSESRSEAASTTGIAGTAYISDAGMTGALNGVIGVKKENVLKKFLDPQAKFKNEPEEEGVMQINGVVIEIDENQKAAKIEKLYEEM